MALAVIKPQAAAQGIALSGKGVDDFLLEEPFGNAVNGLRTPPFGQRQDALGMALKRCRFFGLECVGQVKQLVADRFAIYC